jgi:uncharacterized protein YqgC (DUF456 family)
MLMKLVAAINGINTPWVAIVVIILGMTFDVVCKKWGIAADAATGVIGAGIGLLTGQALSNRTSVLTETVHEPATPIAPKETTG